MLAALSAAAPPSAREPRSGGAVSRQGADCAAEVLTQEQRFLEVMEEGKKYNMIRTESQLDREFEGTIADVAARGSLPTDVQEAVRKAVAEKLNEEAAAAKGMLAPPTHRRDSKAHTYDGSTKTQVEASVTVVATARRGSTRALEDGGEGGAYEQSLQESEARIRAKIQAIGDSAKEIFSHVPEAVAEDEFGVKWSKVNAKQAVSAKESLHTVRDELVARRQHLLQPLSEAAALRSQATL